MASEKSAAAGAKQPATFVEKVGPSQRLWVAWRPEARPTFPPHCPCCLDRPSPNRHIVVRNESLGLGFDFPACGVCARHVVVNEKIVDAMGAILLALTVLTIAAGLFALGGWTGLLEPFRDLIRGVATLLVGFVVMIFWSFAVRWAVIWPLERILGLHKPNCRWFDSPVRWGTFDKLRAKGFGFENVEYGRRFARANGVISGVQT